MKKLAALLVLCTITFETFAQTSGQIATYTPGVGAETDGLYLYAMGDIESKLAKLNYEDNSIEGSPYMSNLFDKAKLYYGDESVGNVYYRYNAYNEEIEIKQTNINDEPVRGLSKDKQIRLVVNGKPMMFRTFIDKKGKTKNGYVTLLTDGDYKLYEHLKVVFKEAKKAENSLVQSSPAKFSQFTEYYLEGPDGKRIDEIELSNKKVLSAVGADNTSKLKVYLKENNIKIKNVQDLQKVVHFLNGQS